MATETVPLFLRVNPALVERIDRYRELASEGARWRMMTKQEACVALMTSALDAVDAATAPAKSKRRKGGK